MKKKSCCGKSTTILSYRHIIIFINLSTIIQDRKLVNCIGSDTLCLSKFDYMHIVCRLSVSANNFPSVHMGFKNYYSVYDCTALNNQLGYCCNARSSHWQDGCRALNSPRRSHHLLRNLVRFHIPCNSCIRLDPRIGCSLIPDNIDYRTEPEIVDLHRK